MDLFLKTQNQEKEGKVGGKEPAKLACNDGRNALMAQKWRKYFQIKGKILGSREQVYVS